MSKYINADTVIQALREIIDQHKDSKMFTRTVRAAENMITIIKRMPSADVVEVVRCKDCKWWVEGPENYEGIPQNKCHYFADDDSYNILPDDFCSRAERKETE
jgi:hypothetical protein